MTLEEAIYGLRHAEIVFERTTGTLGIVLDAAKKQILQRVNIHFSEKSHKPVGFYCPNCGKNVLGSGFYCWRCGQHLDWGNEK